MPKNNFIKISDINAAMSYSLGFNSKRECLQFIKEHKIETSKKSFDEFENSILKVQNKILMKNQLKQLNEIDRLKNAVLKEKNINQVSINLTVSFLLYSPIPGKVNKYTEKSKIITDKDGKEHYLRYVGSINNVKNTIVKKYVGKRVFYYDTAFSQLMKIVDPIQTSDGYSALIIKSVEHPTKEEIRNAKNKNFKKEYKKSDFFNDDSER